MPLVGSQKNPDAQSLFAEHYKEEKQTKARALARAVTDRMAQHSARRSGSVESRDETRTICCKHCDSRTMTTPYRKPQPPPRDVVADRLECWLRDGDRNRWVRAVYVKAWITVVVCGFLLSSGARLAAVPVVAIGALWALRDVQQRKGARVVFTVRTGRVRIDRAAGALDLALDELADVRLDTKSTSKNLTVARADGVNTIFGSSSNHNIDIDVSRVELHIDGEDEPVLLDREFISGSLCAEELRAIRLFLRAHGWTPADERPATS